jgi:hypothetical protein
VFVVDTQKVAHRKTVEAGPAVDGKMQVLSGLAVGEVVVVEGAYGLPDGATVQIAKAAKEPEKDEK